MPVASCTPNIEHRCSARNRILMLCVQWRRLWTQAHALNALRMTDAHQFGSLAEKLQSGTSVQDALHGQVYFAEQTFSAESQGRWCTNLHTVVASPRGDGSEALALFMPISLSCEGTSQAMGSVHDQQCWSAQTPSAAATALMVGTALSDYLAQVPWLARDFVWVVLDARYATRALPDYQQCALTSQSVVHLCMMR